jgi:hypothetical protein
MGRSNLRAKQDEGGYNLVDVTKDSIFFTTENRFRGRKKHGPQLKLRMWI